jgi:hypothetical protein
VSKAIYFITVFLKSSYVGIVSYPFFSLSFSQKLPVHSLVDFGASILSSTNLDRVLTCNSSFEKSWIIKSHCSLHFVHKIKIVFT